nr:hypothetical protein [Kofleriaceae bacterium]
MRAALVAVVVVGWAGAAGCGGGKGAASDAPRGGDGARVDSSSHDAPGDADRGSASPLTVNRDRLLATYLAFLQSEPTVTQTTGLSGANLTSTCQLWTALDGSSQLTFLTITARLQGSKLQGDGSTMLDHVVTLYRVAGGQGAVGSAAPGSCGGGEYNRVITSIDATLHAAQVALTIDDIPAGMAWRASHDLGGPHAPFDTSDETNQGAPRGQTQYFSDPTSALANTALGRQDLETLVDPNAMEMDQDYDCPHNSNPMCSYNTYGPLCAVETDEEGVVIYEASYGTIESDYSPCQ